MRVITVSGPPGAGKTEVGRRLIEWCPERSALIDTDAIAGIHPWRVDEELYRLAGRNLVACLHGFLEWGARICIVTGVLIPEGIFAYLGPALADERMDWRLYGLQASAAVLDARIAADTKGQDADQRRAWTYLNERVGAVPGCRVVETDSLSLEQVVEWIGSHEDLQQPGARTRGG